jgi:predicted transcriptional regulator
MSMLAYKQRILAILAENLKNSEPQVVSSDMLSARINLPIKDTCQLIKVMNQMGIIESDQDGQRSLITRQGMMYLKELQLSKAA